MSWLDLFNRDPAFWSLVLDVLDKAAKRPHVMPVCLRQSLSNIRQLLEHDHVAVVFDGFSDDLVGDHVDVLFPPGSLTLPKPKQGVVCGLCFALLHLRTPFLELSNPVVVLVTTPERACAGDGKTVHAEVDTEDCLVPGIVRTLDFDSLTVVVYLPRFDMEVELVGGLVVLESARPKLVVFREDVLLVWCGTGCWQLKVALDATIHRGE